MRAHNGVASELSGGLDSSSIVCAAQSMIRAGEISVPKFEAFSLAYNESSTDERVYANEAASKSEVKLNWIQPYEIDMKASIDGVRRSREWGEHPNGPHFRSLRQAVADKGIRVLMTGLRGDQFLTGTRYHYAELLSGFKLAERMRVRKTHA